MNVLVVGSGGREHAIAWKVAQSNNVKQVYVVPGNAGTAHEAKLINVNIDPLAIDELIQFAQQQQIDLTIIGPEAPLAAGIIDQFKAANLACFGPTQKAAQLESSKAFSKAFMHKYRIPTARYACFEHLNEAKQYIANHSLPVVIKADGLAAGKGVVIAHTLQEANAALENMLEAQAFGQAGSRVVIEEFLEGEEVSFIVLADGKHALAMATSQDHKARDNGDRGPNTGGMGAYSPAPLVTAELHARIMQDVIHPTIEGMIQEGTPYCGFLYAGLMINKKGEPKVLEYNCRLGDPETEVLMPRLKSDLCELIFAALQQKLNTISAEWDPRFCLGVVMAAKGYPEHYPKNEIINGLNENTIANTYVFHAGTREHNQHILTNGGRVLCVTALGETVEQAQQHAYKRVKTISWDHVYYRDDIGYKALRIS